MAYGLPAIVPPIGGILEVIDAGKSGFAVDSRDSNQLNKTLVSILDNRNTYTNMSSIAKERLTLFKEAEMMKKVTRVLFQT
jgi:glycosyltransferase involved in cell wall biosynthesis